MSLTAQSGPRVAVVAITRHGVALAARVVAQVAGARLYVPEKFAAEAAAGGTATGDIHAYPGKTGALIPELFAGFDAVVAVISLGAMVRLIAPHLKSKDVDPAVVVLDEAGKFVIPMLSGHLGGANALAGRLAQALGATAVLTTASDALETLCVDILGRELGWTLDAPHDTVVRVSAAVVNGDPVALVQEDGRRDWWTTHANGRQGELPANIVRCARLEDVAAERFAAVLWISRREMPKEYAERFAGRCVSYRPEPV